MSGLLFRIGQWLFGLLFAVIVFGGITAFLLFAPGSPLPAAWNPTKPLDIKAPVTAATGWKLSHALADGDRCLAALQTGAVFQHLSDLQSGPHCGISPRVALSSVGGLRVTPVETRCQTALRFAIWARHGIDPAARARFGVGVSEMTHLSSYNCRQIRLASGVSGRMSTHATGDAIDITGVVLADGRRLSLRRDWASGGPDGAFLRDIRDAACTWFRVTLGPDYNHLHADHFHLQNTGWGLCR
jgi:hypothetical protein